MAEVWGRGNRGTGEQGEEKAKEAEEEEKVGGQKEENRMEGVEEGSSSFSLVIYSVGTRAR